eukprot:CAMPEP_0180658902 /NCGR_PEP_ID=MMETSP1037_2-20121125/57275_1 /TAXON_ID=632150 /ORGANISM="Azadinium spinosum, Strain 3D9" /LENGTH=219 /DNA_ID=CAMNT_0022685867 /DNA_START=114 /DNA_END=769 /DNA_ORIENTATION=-
MIGVVPEHDDRAGLQGGNTPAHPQAARMFPVPGWPVRRQGLAGKWDRVEAHAPHLNTAILECEPDICGSGVRDAWRIVGLVLVPRRFCPALRILHQDLRAIQCEGAVTEELIANIAALAKVLALIQQGGENVRMHNLNTILDLRILALCMSAEVTTLLLAIDLPRKEILHDVDISQQLLLSYDILNDHKAVLTEKVDLLYGHLILCSVLDHHHCPATQK